MSSTNKGRTVQIQKVSHRPENDPKREASSHTEELVISTSFVKKIKTEDLIQIRQKVTERRDTEAKKQKKKMTRCWVPVCTADARYLKAHACYDHLPTNKGRTVHIQKCISKRTVEGLVALYPQRHVELLDHRTGTFRRPSRGHLLRSHYLPL